MSLVRFVVGRLLRRMLRPDAIEGHLGDDAGWPLERSPYLLETSMPGVFAAGDVRHGAVKRVASAVGEGSIAIQLVHQLVAEGRLHDQSRPTTVG